MVDSIHLDTINIFFYGKNPQTATSEKNKIFADQNPEKRYDEVMRRRMRYYKRHETESPDYEPGI